MRNLKLKSEKKILANPDYGPPWATFDSYINILSRKFFFFAAPKRTVLLE